MFRKVLVANRGEIALRVIRTCQRLQIRTVAVYSEADRGSPHVRAADEAILLGPAPVRQSYLDADRVVEAIRSSGAEAVHPGYGLLSESSAFARQVSRVGAVFVGPPPEALDVFGDKLRARSLARSAGVPPPPGSDGPIDPDDLEHLSAEAARIGYPVIIKAAGGGGGIGMQRVDGPDSLSRAARTCSDRGKAAFDDPRVYMERYLDSPRHIEVQVLFDASGGRTALGERECSVQRRHQKIIEETPSPAPFLMGMEGRARRERLSSDALVLLERAGYVGAGTVEFVADAAGNLYFLEVNARLQVEHPVTEAVTGLDLVELQLRVASGEALPREATHPTRSGHAIEARLYAEDPAKGFLPQPGTLSELAWPEESAGVRIDAGFERGEEVTVHYDPLIAKIIAHGTTRDQAIERLDRALGSTRVELVGPRGPRSTNVAFLRTVLGDQRFASGRYDTGLVGALGASR